MPPELIGGLLMIVGIAASVAIMFAGMSVMSLAARPRRRHGIR
jgi:hypothetical protein